MPSATRDAVTTTETFAASDTAFNAVTRLDVPVPHPTEARHRINAMNTDKIDFIGFFLVCV